MQIGSRFNLAGCLTFACPPKHRRRREIRQNVRAYACLRRQGKGSVRGRMEILLLVRF